MSRDEILSKVREIVAERLALEPDAVHADASFADDLGADSLDTVELVMAFEDGFDVEISDEDAERITTVKEAVDFLTQVVTA
jgi:acyl carrier protein